MDEDDYLNGFYDENDDDDIDDGGNELDGSVDSDMEADLLKKNDPEAAAESIYYRARDLNSSGEAAAAIERYREAWLLEQEFLGQPGAISLKCARRIAEISVVTSSPATIQNAISDFSALVQLGARRGRGVQEAAYCKAVGKVLDLATSRRIGRARALALVRVAIDAVDPHARPSVWLRWVIRQTRLLVEDNPSESDQLQLRLLLARAYDLIGDDLDRWGSHWLQLNQVQLELELFTGSMKAAQELVNRVSSQKISDEGLQEHKMGLFLYVRTRRQIECGDYEPTYRQLFSAYGYLDEVQSSHRIPCLQLMILVSILLETGINPFQSQELAPLRHNLEIEPFALLLEATQKGKASTVLTIAEEQAEAFSRDELIKQLMVPILASARKRGLIELLRVFQCVRLSYLSEKLRCTPEDLTRILAQLILDGFVRGLIHQEKGLFMATPPPSSFRAAIVENMEALQHVTSTIFNSLSVTSSSKFDEPVD